MLTEVDKKDGSVEISEGGKSSGKEITLQSLNACDVRLDTDDTKV